MNHNLASSIQEIYLVYFFVLTTYRDLAFLNQIKKTDLQEVSHIKDNQIIM
jgi:hypothetical protein